MRDNIMYYPAIVLMVVEALAFGFLIRGFVVAKRKQKREETRQYPKSTEIDFDYAAEDD